MSSRLISAKHSFMLATLKNHLFFMLMFMEIDPYLFGDKERRNRYEYEEYDYGKQI
jgi:hypothetical protein